MGLLSVLLLLLGLIYTAHCQSRGTIRLVRSGSFSSTFTAGIVQIYYFTSSYSTNRWGNICYDSSFGSTEASVICNQLGYNGASSYGRTGSTSSYGTDSSAAIIGVSCSNTTRIWNNPYSGQIRLQGGTYSSYGRLEVYCNGQWGTVCDDSFGPTDARVACRQLGYSDYYSYSGNLAGSSSQPIWLDSVSCSSSYTCLATCESCPSSQYHNCRHSEDVALGCEFDTSQAAPRNTLSTCRYASTEGPTSTGSSNGGTSNEAGIIAGIVVSVLICLIVIFAVPISISCCLGFAGANSNSRRNGRATVVTTGATSATVTTTNLAAPPPPTYNQQPPPPAAGYDVEKAPYPPQLGYPAQPGYPPQV
uniref:SRCR domain-containing protein n=1 Tax=Amphimedon queenslandica TaxID=400682 RepID=A0A1X7U7E9_AMPQE